MVPLQKNPGNPSDHTPIQKRILTELYALEELGRLDLQVSQKSRNHFLSNFDWTDSTLDQQTQASREDLLVQFNEVFARHRFDIGIKKDYKVKLTPVDERAALSHSLPVPLNLKEDIMAELALLHKYGIIRTLPYSKYASPIFAQRKPKEKLRLLFDLRKINNFISDNYIIKNHPISTLADAAQHMAQKKFFANWIVHRRITAFKTLTKDEQRC